MSLSTDSSLDMECLRDIYLCANTPIYLYTRFRREPSVQALARDHEADELINWLKQLLESRDSEAGENIQTYAVLASLSFKTKQEISQLEALSCTNVEWFDKLKCLALEDAANASILKIDLRKPPVALPKGQSPNSNANAASNSVSMTISLPIKYD